MTLTQTLLIALIQAIMVVTFIFVIVPLTIFAERKVLGHIQERLGSTRIAGSLNGLTGFTNRFMWGMGKYPLISYWRGIPGLVGDIVKMLIKEDVRPTKADRFVYFISPAICFISAVATFAAISFVPGTLFTFPMWVPVIGGLPLSGSLTDMNIGLLWILGVASVGVYGIVLAGWASNSKYPLLGGLRSGAQIISYEVPLTLSLLAPVILTGSLNFSEIATRMATQTPIWSFFPQVFGFLIYFTCGFAETNRLPFDMPEAESELVAGFHTEYSGMKWGFFYLGEYINMVVVSAIAAGFFLGGPYLLPFGLQGLIPSSWPILGQPSILFFIAKMGFLLFTYIWVRGTFPRYRYDQIMHVGWKYLIPLALVNLFLAAAVRYGA